MQITPQEARLLVLVLEKAQKHWFKPETELPIQDQLFQLYEKLHLFSDRSRQGPLGPLANGDRREP